MPLVGFRVHFNGNPMRMGRNWSTIELNAAYNRGQLVNSGDLIRRQRHIQGKGRGYLQRSKLITLIFTLSSISCMFRRVSTLETSLILTWIIIYADYFFMI